MAEPYSLSPTDTLDAHMDVAAILHLTAEIMRGSSETSQNSQ